MAAALPPNVPTTLSATARAVLRVRQEQGKLPAILLAILVHAGFVALIVFGVSWQVKTPAPLMAEVWSQLPAISAPKPPPVNEVEPAPLPIRATPPAPKVEAPPTPVQPSKADIQLVEKKVREEKIKRELEEKKVLEQKKREEREVLKRAEEKKKADDEKLRKAEDVKRKAAEDKARVEAEARDAAIRGARDAAIKGYTDKISQLIRSRANIPDSVMGKPIIEVRVRLLAGSGSVLAQVVKPSGNRVYDEAVERAINGIQNWPSPDDPAILGLRRELILRIEHER